MEWTFAFTAALAAALAYSRPKRGVVALMLLNLAATLWLAPEARALALADLGTAAAMLACGPLGMVLAVTFAAMAVADAAAGLGFPIGTTFAIVEALAVLQVLIIAGWHHGIDAIRRRPLVDRRGLDRRGAGHLGGAAPLAPLLAAKTGQGG